MERNDAATLIDEARDRLERLGWSMTEASIGSGWQVTGDNGKIMLLVHAGTLAGAWIGLMAEAAELDHHSRPEPGT
jgi:hypothetical protein